MEPLLFTFDIFGTVVDWRAALGEELAGVKAVPPDKLRPWPLGTGRAVRDWLERRAQEPGTVA